MARAGGLPDPSFGPGLWMPGGWTGVLRRAIARVLGWETETASRCVVCVVPHTVPTPRLLVANLTFKDSPNHQCVNLGRCTGHAVCAPTMAIALCRLQLYASHTEVVNVSILAPSSSPNTASTIAPATRVRDNQTLHASHNCRMVLMCMGTTRGSTTAQSVQATTL